MPTLDSIDLTVVVGIENVDEKKIEDFNGCGNAKFNGNNSISLSDLVSTLAKCCSYLG